MQLSGLFVYPIKACGGISIERSAVAARGLELDRRYMLVDRDGKFVSQRERSELSQVSIALERGEIVATAPGALALALPRALEEGEATTYRVWDSVGSALVHAEGSRWFSELLSDELRLVYMPESERRAVNPQRAAPGDIVSFADGYPFLLISQESLEDLNARLPLPLEMRRFRPNLVITGCAPYAEDGFTRLRIGELAFRAVKRCDRCNVTAIDPASGRRGKEPLRTLAQYRLEAGKVWFGMNLIHDAPGSLALGDELVLDSPC